jgi:hypothetical protein
MNTTSLVLWITGKGVAPLPGARVIARRLLTRQTREPALVSTRPGGDASATSLLVLS